MGPTAVGKTGICAEICERVGAEIVSCDSRQVYRYMNIGTAKPTAAEKEKAPHHLIDFITPDQVYSAHDWACDAQEVLEKRLNAGKQSMVVGGTGFYLRSLVEGLSRLVPANPAFRKMCEKKVQSEGGDSIFKELERVDPALAHNLHPNDTQRAIRALEVFHTTGRPPSELKRLTQPSHSLSFRVLVLMLDREKLYRRIESRVDRMFRNGLWEEFKWLLEKGYTADSPGMRCVGYQELFSVIQGDVSLEEALELIRRNTRRYAKRQMTWFRNQTKGHILDITTLKMSEVVERVQQFAFDS